MDNSLNFSKHSKKLKNGVNCIKLFARFPEEFRLPKFVITKIHFADFIVKNYQKFALRNLMLRRYGQFTELFKTFQNPPKSPNMVSIASNCSPDSLKNLDYQNL